MRTDPTSLIRMGTQPVRQLSVRPLVWLAVLSTTAILACKDDPSGLGGTGSLVLIVVPYEKAQPTAQPDAKGQAAAANAGDPNPSLAPAAAEGRSPHGAVTEAATAGSAAEAAQQQSRRDFVRITLAGPTNLTQDVTPNADGSVDVTIPDLLVGSYEVQLFGIDNDLGGEVISEFGRTTGVQVREDQTTQATISFGSFVPDLDPNIATTTAAFAFEVNFRRVAAATDYLAEADIEPTFANPVSITLADTTAILTVNNTGPVYVRVRAQNSIVTFAQARPSGPLLIQVVEDVNPTGDTDATAPTLGVGLGANGQYGGYNIFPATDEDWFAVDLVTGTAMTVDVLTTSLSAPASEKATLALNLENSSPSALDPEIAVFDASLTLLDSNDDRDGTTLESRVTDVPINADGTYFIRVTSHLGGSVGHYDLLIDVNAAPVATVSVDPPAATILPSATVQLTGRTFDGAGGELFGREAIWTTSDANVATVAPNGLVSGVADGTATITFSSETITASATITVSSVSVAKVVITPTGNVIDGIGQSAAFTAEALDDQDVAIAGKPINWYAANTYVATVDNTGLAQSVAHGQTVITAEADGVEGYAVVTVNDVTTIDANFWDVHPQASGTAQILRDVWAERKDAVYVVGQTGTVLFNDGTGWAAQANPATDAVRAIWGVDEYSLVAVGNSGLIMETGDRGQTWVAESPSPTSLDLWDVWGSSLDNVWAAGGNSSIAGTGIIVHYDGSAWAVEPTGAINHVAAIWGFASDDVWAVGDFGLVLHNDGTGWAVQPAPTGNNFTALWGPRSTDLFAATASGEVFRYNGTSWVLQLIPASPGLWAIHGTSSDDVYVVGETATLLRFDGVNWMSLGSTAADNLLGVFSTPNGDVMAVGNGGMIQQGTRGATVVVTPDPSGITALGNQVQLSSEVHDAAGNVVASGDIFGWTSSDDLIATVSATGLVTAVANGTVTIAASISGVSGTADVTVRQLAATITVTPDGTNATTTGPGLTFSGTADDANANPIPGASFTWSSLNPNVATINATTGQLTIVASGQATIAAELDGTLGYALVNVAIPGATTVDLVSADASGTTEPMFGVWGTSATDIFAVRSAGTVLHYDGTSWTATPTGTTSRFNDVWGSSSSDVFAVGAGGTVFHYDGSTWASMPSGTAEELWAVWGSSPRNVFVGGNNGTLLHYDGNGWNTLTSGTINELRGIWGTSGSDVFVVGTAGTVLHYDGASWTAMTSNTTADLLAVWGGSSTDVFAVGRGGTIIRYTGTWAAMTSPTSSSLSGLWGSAASDVYGAGDLGTLAYYDGVNWTTLPTGTTENLEAIWGTPNPAILMVGANGTIARGSRGATIAVSPTAINLDALGAKQQLTPTATDEDANDISGVTFLYTSDNVSVADVSATGEVESFSNGNANITASVQGGAQTAIVPVTVSQVAVAFAIVPNTASIAIGATVQLTGGSLDANNNALETQPPITWSTDDPAVATVDGTGLVTAVGVGTATIGATDGTNNATADITVTVPNTAATIAAGGEHSCAIADGGAAYCWGHNGNGQLGDGTTSPSPNPVQVAGGLTFASIATGGHHSCGLAPDGTAYCWGQNGDGRLGDNTFANSSTPVAVAGGLQFAEMSGGGFYTCAITTTGVPYCWGRGDSGQLGDGTGTNQGQPVGVAGAHTFQSIATGQEHSCGVDLTGNVYCWGFNDNGQLGNGTTTQSNVPVMVSNPLGLVFRAVAVGGDHSCALVDASDVTDPSAVYCWGRNASGELGNATNTNSSTPVRTFGAFLFESIEAGADHTCATTTAGAGLCWGRGYDGTIGNGNFNDINIPTTVNGGLIFAQIAAGGTHSCGRTTGGDAYCWGRSDRGQLGTGDPLTNQPAFALGGVASVATGEGHTCVLSSGGSASCVGKGTSGQLGQGVYQNELSPVAVSGGFTFVSVEAGVSHSCGLETSPGDIYCWGASAEGELGNGSFGSTNAPAIMVTGGHSFVEVAVGPYHNCGLTDLVGDVYCWGENFKGELGNNSTTNSANPVLVSGANTYTTVTAGENFTCALTDTGLAYCWGRNDNGQLGDATFNESPVPVAVAGGATFTQIAAGGGHVCTLDATGAAYCWGRGYSGQLGDNQFNISNVPQAVAGGFTFTDLTAGSDDTCAIRATGETMCWGRNTDGELGDGTFDDRGIPTTVSGGLSFTNLGGSYRHTCGVTADGSLYCWGSNSEGELGLGFTNRVATPAMVAGGLTFVIPPPEER